jgi:hypothetical protein
MGVCIASANLCGPLRISASAALETLLTQRTQRYAEGRRDYLVTAMASISMRASRGKRATWTVVRAGGSPLNCLR